MESTFVEPVVIISKDFFFLMFLRMFDFFLSHSQLASFIKKAIGIIFLFS